MKIKLQVLIFALIISVSIFGEEPFSYTPATIQFERLENDTLDNLVARIGKDSLIKELDRRIVNATENIKSLTPNIKHSLTAQQLYILNKNFKLNIDSFLIFPNIYEKIFIDSSNSVLKLYGKRYGDTIEALNYITAINKEKIDINKEVTNQIYNASVRSGFAIFCDLIHQEFSPEVLDTLYKGALLYSSDIRNEFYFAILEFDKSCGTEENKAAYYRHQLYEKTYPLFNLNSSLSDTTGLSAINALKHNLIEKYKLLAYSLYAKDFDIKAKQKDVIYFLSSQTNMGGFREYNTADFGPNAEATVYGLWSLLELRKQIKEIY